MMMKMNKKNRKTPTTNLRKEIKKIAASLFQYRITSDSPAKIDRAGLRSITYKQYIERGSICHSKLLNRLCILFKIPAQM